MESPFLAEVRGINPAGAGHPTLRSEANPKSPDYLGLAHFSPCCRDRCANYLATIGPRLYVAEHKKQEIKKFSAVGNLTEKSLVKRLCTHIIQADHYFY